MGDDAGRRWVGGEMALGGLLPVLFFRRGGRLILNTAFPRALRSALGSP